MAQPSLKPTGLRELRRADGAYEQVERALRLALGLPGPGQSHVGFKDAKRVPDACSTSDTSSAGRMAFGRRAGRGTAGSGYLTLGTVIAEVTKRCISAQ